MAKTNYALINLKSNTILEHNYVVKPSDKLIERVYSTLDALIDNYTVKPTTLPLGLSHSELTTKNYHCLYISQNSCNRYIFYHSGRPMPNNIDLGNSLDIILKDNGSHKLETGHIKAQLNPYKKISAANKIHLPTIDPKHWDLLLNHGIYYSADEKAREEFSSYFSGKEVSLVNFLGSIAGYVNSAHITSNKHKFSKKHKKVKSPSTIIGSKIRDVLSMINLPEKFGFIGITEHHEISQMKGISSHDMTLVFDKTNGASILLNSKEYEGDERRLIKLSEIPYSSLEYIKTESRKPFTNILINNNSNERNIIKRLSQK